MCADVEDQTAHVAEGGERNECVDVFNVGFCRVVGNSGEQLQGCHLEAFG